MVAAPLVKQLLQHRGVLLGFIYALTRDYDAAEEIFQEVAVAILEEARKETDVAHFLAWAREIARRRVREFFRKGAKERAVQPLSEALEEAISQAFAENERALENQQQRWQYLQECLERLAGRSREVIEGFYHGRKSIRELAAALAWQENSVKVALSRTRKVLADCIQVKLHRQQMS